MAYNAFRSFRWRRFAAAGLSAATVLTASGVSAQETHYVDVQAGVWFEEAAAALLESGALDESEARLRPNDLATRAEVLKLLVNVYGEDLVNPATPSFTDVPRTAWYYPYVETAARAGWIKGDRDCYGTGARPCTARPADGVNRAEMAVLLQRAFRLAYLGIAPEFPDNTNRNLWYYNPVQTAADHCILEGDGGTGRVRPAAGMNRAEMVVMFHRASQGLRYGDDCGERMDGRIVSVEAMESDRVRVTFNVDLDANRLDDLDRYSVERTSNGDDVGIDDIEVLSARSVELMLDDPLTDDATYRVEVTDLRTDRGLDFDDSRTFTFRADEIEEDAEIESVTVRDDDTIRVRFSEDVDATFADDASRYAVVRTSNGVDIDVDSVTVVDDRTVDINLEADLAANVTYRLEIENMRSDDDEDFDDTITFSLDADDDPAISNVTVRDNNTIRIDFSEDVVRSLADDISRYTVVRVSNGAEVDVDTVVIVDDNTVDLNLESDIVSNVSYRVTVEDLETEDDNEEFTDEATFPSTGVTGDATIQSVTAVSATRLRVTFSEDVDEARAEDEIRYRLSGNDGDVDIGSVGLIDDNVVEIVLDESLVGQDLYTLTVTNLLNTDDESFTDDIAFVYGPSNLTFRTTLSGSQEVPAVSTSATGTGSFTLTATGLQYDITLRNLSGSTITGAHFHPGAPGQEGGPIENITFNGTTLRATGTWTDLTALERSLLLDEDIYVNVHTTANPDGEIRGQVVR